MIVFVGKWTVQKVMKYYIIYYILYKSKKLGLSKDQGPL